MPTLTPNQAAKKLGISFRTIMRAIGQHKLHAIRDNCNQWQTDDADIVHWGCAVKLPAYCPSNAHSCAPYSCDTTAFNCFRGLT